MAGAFSVALTISSSVGVSRPASLWAYRMAAVRRQMVEALTFRLASRARKAATVAGDAGRTSSWRSSHHARKMKKSLP